MRRSSVTRSVSEGDVVIHSLAGKRRCGFHRTPDGTYEAIDPRHDLHGDFDCGDGVIGPAPSFTR